MEVQILGKGPRCRQCADPNRRVAKSCGKKAQQQRNLSVRSGRKANRHPGVLLNKTVVWSNIILYVKAPREVRMKEREQGRPHALKPGIIPRGLHARYSEAFVGRLEKVRVKDPEGYRKIRRVMDRILQSPGEADGVMHGVHHGRLKKYAGRRDYRLIYDWCEVCRKANRHLQGSCPHCEKVEDHSVIFFDLYHKKDAKKLRS